MSPADLIVTIRVLLDQCANPDDRSAAARQLVGWADEPSARDSLIQAVCDDRTDARVAYAAGESLAEVLLKIGQVKSAPLAELTGPAYLGFDSTVARVLPARAM